MQGGSPDAYPLSTNAEHCQSACASLDSGPMELHFTPEQEAQLAQVAQHAGKSVEQSLIDAALAMLHERDAFLAAADRGEFVDDDEVRHWLEERERS